jgi:hypothetical protein
MEDRGEVVSGELELAAAIGKELSPAAVDFAATVTRSPARELGEWITDHIRARRYRSQLRLLEKAQAATVDAGLLVHAVPLKTLVPLLEGVAVEDDAEHGARDDSMVDRWANLLANAATDSTADVHPSFPGFLRELDGLDAQILDTMYERSGGLPAPPDGRGHEWDTYSLSRAFGLKVGRGTDALRQERLDNLVRLGLCFHPILDLQTMTLDDLRFGRPSIIRDRIGLSHLGVAFVRACQPPEQPRPEPDSPTEPG